ncbi:MAG: UDP-N-acetylmuramoyl-L-alanine--D-glutamate ligase [Betaproteobacteria bacterium]|nr:UDP-N-acetylmuramoyl-L-alanine--D-glutamate ligase [Betaproteobacteria bacterium]
MREPAFSLLRKPVSFSLKGKRVLVLGLGDTGLSVANWVGSEGGIVRAADTRAEPPRKKDFSGELHAGKFTASLLKDIDLVCISPGLSLQEEVIQAALAKNIPVVGDIELFAWAAGRETAAMVLAVTGTNGKSTVTALTGHLLRSAGVDCEVAGNISPPALDAFLKRKNPPAAWVLELSSYQLETTWSLAPVAAAMLNLSEDHLDRYAGLAEYAEAKARIFVGEGAQVLNRCDSVSMALALPSRTQITFGLDAPSMPEDFGIDGIYLARGTERILPVAELPLAGAHNVSNALAACALACLAGVPLSALARGLRSFHGLPHRMQRVALRGGVEWLDDSKGTNVGATAAALIGLSKKAVLILGGEGKGQKFAPLAPAIRAHAKHVLLIGRDAALIEMAIAASGVPLERIASMEEAVARAAQIAAPHDAVLLSPACASFDMFRDYRHRGDVFAAAVKALGHE